MQNLVLPTISIGKLIFFFFTSLYVGTFDDGRVIFFIWILTIFEHFFRIRFFRRLCILGGGVKGGERRIEHFFNIKKNY